MIGVARPPVPIVIRSRRTGKATIPTAAIMRHSVAVNKAMHGQQQHRQTHSTMIHIPVVVTHVVCPLQ